MALRPLWLALSAIARRVREATSLQVACDFDGTLVPLSTHPSEAVLPERAHEAISGLLRTPASRVAVFSGRRVCDLAQRTRLDGAFLAGVGGFEMREPGGAGVLETGPERTLPRELREDLAQWSSRFPGAWLEDKGLAIALHYRAVPEAQQAAFGAGVRRRMRQWAAEARLEPGRKVFEVLPPPGSRRVDALHHWLQGSEDGLLCFLGDDPSDDPLHGLTRERHGVAVSVGNIHSRAEFLLPSTEEVVWLLEWLGREWAQCHPEGARSRGAA